MDSPIHRYLEDAIAAEKSFETQLTGFADEASLPQARELFEVHAGETRRQYQSLTARLERLGGNQSGIKSFFAHLFNMSPKMAQIGHEAQERTTQDLIMAYSVENAEVAMYESLSIAAETAGDMETASLARRIQQEERATAEKIWPLISTAAHGGVTAASADEGVRAAVVRYLQDAEAAERNFEDALATFSKSGDSQEVRSLMAMMSNKARTQHERLYARLQALGGDRSTGKSFMAHALAFTPTTAQMGHSDWEKNTQHLMITYAAAAAEMGMYEALATAAEAAGDTETVRLARQLQQEEKEDYTLAWNALPETARVASQMTLSRTE